MTASFLMDILMNLEVKLNIKHNKLYGWHVIYHSSYSNKLKINNHIEIYGVVYLPRMPHLPHSTLHQ